VRKKKKRKKKKVKIVKFNYFEKFNYTTEDALIGSHDKPNLTILRNLTLLPEMLLGSLYHSLRAYQLEDTY